MPAQLDDPSAPQQFRRSGVEPHPTPGSALPADLVPRQVTLRDRVSQATVLPFNSPSQLPASLVSYLCDQFAKEIEGGDTYPMLDPMPLEAFGQYWFGVFGAVMIAAEVDAAIAMVNGSHQAEPDWSKVCLGSFYTKPNYPGRSSHICNAGFLVTDAARNKGIGKLLGEAYLDWAPKLGYSYSVFNLVYETNVASCRIWDSLGFKRIGRVPKCGNLKSYPDQFIDAIIYGRELGVEGEEDTMTEERFDKIRYYLTHQTYPPNSTRAEKSRLRSAATHYRLLPSLDLSNTEPRLMLKDKEVVADPDKQYEIARSVHARSHAGINKTTAQIAEKYHWIRIKETVSVVIRECIDCGSKEVGSKSAGNNNGHVTVASRGIGTTTGTSNVTLSGIARNGQNTGRVGASIVMSEVFATPPTPYTPPQPPSSFLVDPQLMSSTETTSVPRPLAEQSPRKLSPFQLPPLRHAQETEQSHLSAADHRSVASGNAFAPDRDSDASMTNCDSSYHVANPTGDVLTSEDVARLTRAARGDDDDGTGGWG